MATLNAYKGGATVKFSVVGALRSGPMSAGMKGDLQDESRICEDDLVSLGLFPSRRRPNDGEKELGFSPLGNITD